MAIAPGDRYQVKIFCRALNANQMGLNIRHWEILTASGVSGTEQKFADALSALLAPLYKVAIAAGGDYFGLTTAKRVSNQWVPQAQTTQGQGNGTATGTLLPYQVSGIISLRTTLPGRENRGRAYIPFPGEDDSSGGLPTAGYVANMTNLADKFVTIPSLVTTDAVPITYSLGGLLFHRSGSGTFSPLTGFVAAQKFATQRRRGAFGRTNDTPF